MVLSNSTGQKEDETRVEDIHVVKKFFDVFLRNYQVYP